MRSPLSATPGPASDARVRAADLASGESCAHALPACSHCLTGPGVAACGANLGADENSSVLVISTEGATDLPIVPGHRRLLGRDVGGPYDLKVVGSTTAICEPVSLGVRAIESVQSAGSCSREASSSPYKPVLRRGRPPRSTCSRPRDAWRKAADPANVIIVDIAKKEAGGRSSAAGGMSITIPATFSDTREAFTHPWIVLNFKMSGSNRSKELEITQIRARHRHASAHAR